MGIAAARDLLLTHFESADSAEPILTTEQRMSAQKLGAMPVRGGDGRMTSAVTRRMLVELHDQGVDLTGLSVGEVAREVVPVDAGESPAAALDSMGAQRIARLPVVDDGLELGIITRGDVLLYLEVEEKLGARITDLVLDVSPNDRMFGGSLAVYLASGVSAVEGVRRAQAAAGRETCESILDFACGHGRVLRALKAEFPRADLAACDIDADGIRFCAQAFGATPFQSHRDPGQIEVTGAFDLIWCGSLLTHLDADLWSPYLRLFESLLRPSGLLLFTVLGTPAEPQLRAGALHGAPKDECGVQAILGGLAGTGFGYSEYEGQSAYGLSFCTPDWVARTIATHERLRRLHHEEGAWGVQDIVACEAV